ncbi:hypothetical protein DL98DRAFT_521619 [Cadophora sp. DSE1049]|nr:hypothetical protein DL98DRAFT_521619 [Cadophora sp. DSE1049]
MDNHGEGGRHHRGVASGGELHNMLNKWAAEIYVNQEDRRLVEEMFDAAHEFIEERQREVADEILAWRDATVEGWGKCCRRWRTA